MSERISDDELRRLVDETTPGPWRLGADLTTINTAYGGDADFVKGGWAKAIAKTTLPKWMPPKQAWPNGQLIALAPALAAEVLQLREEVAHLRKTEPDYCYDPEEWDCTYPWEVSCEIEEVLLYGPGKGADHVARACTLIKGPDKWVTRIPLDTDGDGEADEWEVKWFDSEEEARAALTGGHSNG